MSKDNIEKWNLFFSRSILAIIGLVEEKSKKVISVALEVYNNSQLGDDFKKTNKFKKFNKICEVCEILRDGFLSKNVNFDRSFVIKHTYKILNKNMALFFPTSNIELFQLKDSNNNITSIIPSLDIYSIVKYLNESEMAILWGNLYLMYICSASMIYGAKNKAIEGEHKEVINNMKSTIVKMGIFQQDGFFNLFVGVNNINMDTTSMNVEDMFNNIGEMANSTNMDTDNLLKMAGLDKLLKSDELMNGLKNASDDDIMMASENIAKLVGADGDEDVKNLCNDLVKDIVGDLKNMEGGFDFSRIGEIAKTVANKMKGNGGDRNTMNKTRAHFENFFNNGAKNLNEFKDANGNPLDDKLLKTLNIPLQLASLMGKK